MSHRMLADPHRKVIAHIGAVKKGRKRTKPNPVVVATHHAAHLSCEVILVEVLHTLGVWVVGIVAFTSICGTVLIAYFHKEGV